jgi:2-polyprenyl-6-methoxyphenol hydroxylase-like FAD-dependent oxidoreductase
MESITTRCVIAGGGPAGMMLGFLLARAGIKVVVLEKHSDFLRDFRGDTIHPSTFELMYELGLLDEFLKLPHQEVARLSGIFNGHSAQIADFSRLPTRCKFIGFMPQWHFLNFLASHAKRFPTFELRMQAEVTDLLQDGDRYTGVRARTPAGDLEIRADLVFGCDGRTSILRNRANLDVKEIGVPIDVLWMHISRHSNDPEHLFGFFRHGKLLVLINREDYFQAGFVIPKGGIEDLKRRGLGALHAEIVALAPFLQDRIAELDDWSKIKLLTVQINRLTKWYRDGLLCIGDAAHAMSPAGGVGINLAIQDAVATANLLIEKLKSNRASVEDLSSVQQRREWPTRLIQGMQAFVHRHVVTGRESGKRNSLPLIVRLLQWFPALQTLPARFIGIGPRPEHIGISSELRERPTSGL